MIYLPVTTAEPIQQGDIFRNIPKVQFQLSSLPIVEDDEMIQKTWQDAAKDVSAGPVAVVVSMQSVTAIVISQDCDAARSEFVSLCQIDDYLITTKGKEPTSPKKWVDLLKRTSRSNNRYFYLPTDTRYGIERRMAVDFRVAIPIARIDLESLRDQRIARLNEYAELHFRESLAHFFRRYAYNEWYPFTKEEYQEYAKDVEEGVTPFPGQT